MPNYTNSLREKCSNTKLFLVRFLQIETPYLDTFHALYSKEDNTTQSKI